VLIAAAPGGDTGDKGGATITNQTNRVVSDKQRVITTGLVQHQQQWPTIASRLVSHIPPIIPTPDQLNPRHKGTGELVEITFNAVRPHLQRP
jgi:hypothetical protein